MSIQPDLFSAEEQQDVVDADQKLIEHLHKQPMYAKVLHVFRVGPSVTVQDVVDHVEAKRLDSLYFGYHASWQEPGRLHLYVYTD
jgi:hypothetical protein